MTGKWQDTGAVPVPSRDTVTFMSRASCPACGTRLDLSIARSDSPSPPPVEPAVLEWLRTVPPGLHRARDLRAWYHSNPARPPLSGPQFGRRLGLLGYRKRQTSQARYWEITGPVPQAKSADLGATGQAN